MSMIDGRSWWREFDAGRKILRAGFKSGIEAVGELYVSTRSRLGVDSMELRYVIDQLSI